MESVATCVHIDGFMIELEHKQVINENEKYELFSSSDIVTRLFISLI